MHYPSRTIRRRVCLFILRYGGTREPRQTAVGLLRSGRGSGTRLPQDDTWEGLWLSLPTQLLYFCFDSLQKWSNALLPNEFSLLDQSKATVSLASYQQIGITALYNIENGINIIAPPPPHLNLFYSPKVTLVCCQPTELIWVFFVSSIFQFYIPKVTACNLTSTWIPWLMSRPVSIYIIWV